MPRPSGAGVVPPANDSAAPPVTREGAATFAAAFLAHLLPRERPAGAAEG